ncbi:MAG TPA: AarF/UbiB family protein [Terriglobales bacterium]|nr:AarF/UbiB family protein [Terriglobales bacterium]
MNALATTTAFDTLDPEQLKAAFFSTHKSFAERVTAIEQALQGPFGDKVREQLGRWVVQRLPGEELVPEKYAHWRPLVRDAMLYVFMHISIPRLAPKLVEQLELPARTPTGTRLLKLISKVPGLQKLGQVLARNRHLLPQLRRSLTKLENGIADMDPTEVQQIIVRELGNRIEAHSVTVKPGIFFEASVSAVIRFTWRNPETGKRERGVFKVLKPFIPPSFAEDMELLAGIAKYVGGRSREYGFAKRVLPETFSDVRRLLQHEVDFPREQKTLSKAARAYGSLIGVRVPRLIPQLSTSRITAMSEERGIKITTAAARLPKWKRTGICEQLIEAFVAVPIFSTDRNAIFHADPHAGNLLYDSRTGDVVILDWALTESVSYEERRRLAMLVLMTALRDSDGIFKQVQMLSRGGTRRKGAQAALVRNCIHNFIAGLPFMRMPGSNDVLNLLEEIAMKGVRLPAPLIMLRKVLFTLDGVQHDMGSPDINMISIVARHATPRWLSSWTALGAPLSLKDWLTVEASALGYGGRVCWQKMQSVLKPTAST